MIILTAVMLVANKSIQILCDDHRIT